MIWSMRYSIDLMDACFHELDQLLNSLIFGIVIEIFSKFCMGK